MHIMKKIKRYLHAIENIESKLEDIQVALGRIEQRQIKSGGG